MRSEQPPPPDPAPTRETPPDAVRPPYRGGVRRLLGLPVNGIGAAAAALAASSAGRHRYEPSPLPAPDESDGGFEESVATATITGEERGSGPDILERARHGPTEESDTVRDFPRAPRPDEAPWSAATEWHAAEGPQPPQPSAGHREQTRLVIPGVSARRTVFPALSETADTPAIGLGGERRDAIPEQAAPLNSLASLPPGREMAASDVELFTRLEQLVTEGVKAKKGSQAPAVSASELPPEPRGELNGERSIPALAQRLDQLQRTVHRLAAAVSSQEARRTESQFHITPPEGPSSAPRAFWERSRLGRGFHTGR